MPGPRLRLLAALTLAAAALYACGGGDGGDVPSDLPLSISTCADAEYGGEGEADALIVSDLPMQGDSAERSSQQVEAIRLVLDQSDWKAGDLGVAFQACDDSIAKTGLWDAKTCRSNADGYAADGRLLGVIGTYNSGCAAEEIPILNRAQVAMISPGNTAVCLTEESPTCEDYSPRTLYPTGDRNYARVVPNDAFQGAGLAEFAKSQGVRNPFVLYAADDPTSTGQATNFRGAAEQLGLHVAGFETWDPKAHDYAGLMEDVKRSGADGVVLAGLIEQNGGQLIRDKARVLGSNADVPLLAFDGFSQQSTIDESGAAAHGMFASIPGKSLDELSEAGTSFVADLKDRLGGKSVELYAPYGGEAAGILLDAIATGGDDRAAVVSAVFQAKRSDILGAYALNSNGDPTVGPVTIFKADGSFDTYDELTPAPAAVDAARLGGSP
jgi:branched-chain amino acid transport system substrate-binding protein